MRTPNMPRSNWKTEASPYDPKAPTGRHPLERTSEEPRRNDAPRPMGNMNSGDGSGQRFPVNADSFNGPKVKVTGLDPDWDAKDIRDIFAEQGFTVTNVWLQFDKKEGRAGQADLAIRTFDEARKVAQDMDRAEVDGWPLAVFVAGGAARSMGGGAGPRDEPRGGGGGNGAERDNGRRNMSKEELDEELARGESSTNGGGGSGGRSGDEIRRFADERNGGGGRNGEQDFSRRNKSKEDLDAELSKYF